VCAGLATPQGAKGAEAACAIIAGMETTSLVLASASPRRRRLLAWLELPYASIATDTDEDLGSPLRRVPPVLARSLAADKARAARAQADAGEPATVLAFDTIVVLDREVLGKPVDRADAERMLRSLSGRTHSVVTGVAVLRDRVGEPETFAVSTPVAMRELDDETIAEWLDGEEALGCAGAYNIERHLASVEDGECYQNVAGLPLCHLYERLARIGTTGIASPLAACEAARGVTCTLGRRVCATARV
jgi:septum formation protein